MLTISSLLAKFKALDTDKAIDEGFTDTMPEFEKHNREQMKAGKTLDGSPIAPKYRSKKYAEGKHAMNPLPGFGVPDLYLTGEFSRQLNAEYRNGVIDVISKDDKGPELEDKYPDIFGLGTNYKSDYQNTNLRPAILVKISNFVGLAISK